MVKKGPKKLSPTPAAQVLPQARPVVLVYAGTLTAFRVKQFKSKQALLLFAARNNLPAEEMAIITGTVEAVHPSYRDLAAHTRIDADRDTLTSAYRHVDMEWN